MRPRPSSGRQFNIQLGVTMKKILAAATLAAGMAMPSASLAAPVETGFTLSSFFCALSEKLGVRYVRECGADQF